MRKRNINQVTNVLCGFSILVSGCVFADDVMVITASGFEQEVQSAPASISVITNKELENKPYRDVTDVLKDIPGVTVSGGGASSDISICGMNANYTLMLVDGKRVRSREVRPNSDGAGFEQGWLPPLSAIERIEVVRGPMSSLYGSDAMGGVINIITKKVSDKWQGNVRLETTFQENNRSKNINTANFSLMGPLIENVLGFQIYGQYSERAEDHYQDGFPEQKLRNITGKLSAALTEKQLVELDVGRSLQSSSSTVGNTASVRDSQRDNNRNTAALTHRGDWDWSTSTTTLSYENTKNPVRDMEIKNLDFDTQLMIPIENHNLTLGGKYSRQKLNDKGNKIDSRITEIKRWDYAFFIEDEWQLIDSFTLVGGMRFNKDELYGHNWNPRLYGVWDFNENYTFKGGISTGYSTPSLRQTVSDWGQVTGGNRSNGVIIGNPDLKPEKSINYEISINYNDDDGTNASATAFYTQFKDKIQSYYLCKGASRSNACNAPGTNEKFDFVQSRENVDKAEIKGLELTFKTPILTNLIFSSNYTWMDTKQKTGLNKGKALNRTPRNKFNTQLDWLVTDDLDLWGKVAYYGIESASGSRTVRDSNYPGYTLWDIGGSYAVNQNTKIYTGIYNLLNKKIENDDYGKTLDGRRYWIGLDVNF